MKRSKPKKFFPEIVLGIGNIPVSARKIGWRVESGLTGLWYAITVQIGTLMVAAYLLIAALGDYRVPVFIWAPIALAIWLYLFCIWKKQMAYRTIRYHYRFRKESENMTHLRVKAWVYFVMSYVMFGVVNLSILYLLLYFQKGINPFS